MYKNSGKPLQKILFSFEIKTLILPWNLIKVKMQIGYILHLPYNIVEMKVTSL